MSNPFAEFEKTASELGFTAQDIEQIKKEASENFNPNEKEKVAQEQSFSNYVEGFVKAAMEHGVSFNEAKELLDVANTVKTAEELNATLKQHFAKNHEQKQKTASVTVKGTEYALGFIKAANDKGVSTEVALNMLKTANPGFDISALLEQAGQVAQAHPKTTGAVAGGALGSAIGGLAGGGKGALAGLGLGAGAGAAAGATSEAYDKGGSKIQQAIENYSGALKNPNDWRSHAAEVNNPENQAALQKRIAELQSSGVLDKIMAGFKG